MTDPSSNVPQQLLRHIHLVCNKQYPVMHRPNVNVILQYLLEALRVVRDEASMTWKTLIEPQPDGKVMLVWQSRQKTDFATDGYVWLDVERSQTHREGQYTIEVYSQNNGYRQQTDRVTLHARRRYRLIPSQPPTPGLQVEPCLWIVHYYQTDPPNQIPINSLAIPEHVKQLLHEQRTMQAHRQLQLQHNEFMLYDRNKWPSIHAPGVPAPTFSQQAMVYPNNVMAQMNRSHLPAYHQYPGSAIPNTAMGPSPVKRARHTSVSQGPTSTTAISQHLEAREAMATDDDTPDYMDTLMPREISALRYKQHHEWLEEVLSSPYDTYQILPEELGLGRKGELESLTKDFFRAHTSKTTGKELREPRTPTDLDVENGQVVVDDDPPPRVGRLPEGKADDFRKLATERMEQIQREMQSMRAEHARQMERVSGIKFWTDAGDQVRASASSAVTGKTSPPEEPEIGGLVSTIAAKYGKHVKLLSPVECIERGGFEDKRPENGSKLTPTTKSNSPPETDTPLLLDDQSKSPSDTPPTTDQVPLDAMPQENLTPVIAPTPSAEKVSAEPVLDEEDVRRPSGGEHSVDDWIMVDQDNEGQDAVNEASAFDSFTNDSAMQIDDKPELESTDLHSTTALQLPDTEFDAGLDLADFNTAGPDLSNYESVDIGGEPESSGTENVVQQQVAAQIDIHQDQAS